MGTLQKVAPLRRIAASFDDVLAAYRAGRFEQCLSALHERDTLQARLLAARCLIRLGQVQSALALCSTIDDPLSLVQRGELAILRAYGSLVLGRLDRADEHLVAARVAAYSAGEPALEADFELTEAWVRFAERDTSAALSALERSFAAAPPLVAWMPDREYFLSMRIVRARAFDLRGVLARPVEGLPVQLQWAHAALLEVDGCRGEDEWLVATLLSNFASAAMEVGDPLLAAEVQDRAENITWVESMRLQRFNVVRFLGWLHALAGNHVGAFREFRRSYDLAPSPVWQIESTLQSCFLARELRQETVADAELKRALEQAATLDASTRTTPAFSALLKLAELAAVRSAAQGRELLNRYRTARAKCPSILFDALDRDWRAKELTAEAAVARAEGNDDLAADLLVNAFDAYDKLGSRWRAALVALELSEITEQPFFYRYAAQEAQLRPHSWLARRLATGHRGPNG